MTDFAPAVAVPAIFLAVGWIIRALATARNEAKLADLQAQLHSRLLDRCQTTEELTSYLNSDLSGALLVRSATERGATLNKVLSSLRTSIVLICFGAAFLFMRNVFDEPASTEAFIVFGGLALALGTGFLIASLMSYFLSKSWGLLEPTPGSPKS